MGTDVVVIGAGYGGLTTAAILAHNGVEVEVLEATGHLGGRSAFDRKDGFIVDYGIHANRFASEGAAAAALREIGHEIDFLPSGEPVLFREGSFVPLPTGVPQFLKAGFLSAGDKVVMVSDMLKLVTARYDRIVDVPLEKAVWGTGRKELGPLFRLLAGIGLIAPEITTTSAGDFAVFLKKALRAKQNVAYPRGGTSQIIEALSKKISESGGVKLNSRVRALDIDSGKVRSARVKEEDVEGRAFVFALPLQKLPEIAGEALDAGFAERCSALIPTAGISVDLCLSERVSDIDGLVVTPDPVTMGQFTSNIDPDTAPAGKQLATFYYPLPVETMGDRSAVEAEEKRLESLLERMFPGIMEKVEWHRSLALRMVDGFEPRVGQSEKHRPGVRAPGVENLFFAGDTVSAPGNGGDVAFASAVAAARTVLEFLG